MSQQTNIVVFDGASTPVMHTFIGSGTGIQDGEHFAIYREQASGIPYEAQPTILLKRKQLSSGIWRLSMRLEVPVMEQISGANSGGYVALPKVAFINTNETVGYFSSRASIQDHRVVRGMMYNLLNAEVTSVPARTSGPAPDLFDSMIVPS